MCLSQEGCGSLHHARWFECWNPAASSKIPVPGASVGCPATPARASPPQPGAPPAPSAPRCHGNQHPPADRPAGMEPFLFLLFRAHFCFHFLGAQPPLSWLSLAVKATCLGWREATDPQSPQMPPRSCSLPTRGQPASSALCPQFEQGTGPLSSWEKKIRVSQGSAACPGGVSERPQA